MMESPFFILLDIDHKPPLPEPPAAAPPPEVLEEEVSEQDEAPETPHPLWQRILGYIVIYGIEALFEFITNPF